MKITDNIRSKPVSKKVFDSSNSELLKTEDYKTTISLVKSLYDGGVLERTPGYCLSISDMLMKMLYSKGIKSSLVECSLTVSTKNPPSMSLIGHDGILKNQFEIATGGLDSHIVVVTQTEIPMLIDLSIGVYDSNIPYICDALNPSEMASLSQYDFENSIWYYETKPYNKLPKLHQQSILDRIKTDKLIFNKISFINKILILITVITSLNFIRGGVDYYFSYIKSNSQQVHK